jgi:hypothetical protein
LFRRGGALQVQSVINTRNLSGLELENHHYRATATTPVSARGWQLGPNAARRRNF